MPRGGARKGAGRASGTGRYGEHTVVIRVPESRLEEIRKLIREGKRDEPSCPLISLPVHVATKEANFPVDSVNSFALPLVFRDLTRLGKEIFMRVFLITTFGLLISTAHASAVDLKDCSAIKEIPQRLTCTEGNVTALSGAIAGVLVAGKEYHLSTRGRCLSYFDENKGAITMTCDHPDLQMWKMQ